MVRALADVRHQKAKFDRSDPKVNGKSGRRPKDRIEEALEQPPGRRRRASHRGPSGIRDDILDPAFRERIRELRRRLRLAR